MPPKKKINSSRSIATLGVAAVVSRKVNNLDKYNTLNAYNILTTRSGRNYEMEKMTGPKVKAVLKKQTSLPAKEAEINGNMNNLKGKKKEENVEKNVKNAGKTDKSNGKAIEKQGETIKNNGKNIKNQGKTVKEQGTVVKDQGRSVRSTRATTRQNGQSTSNNNGNDETWEEEEKEKTPKKRKHFPLFEKTPASQKNKKFKKGQPLKIWTWNVAGLRANVKKNGHLKIKESDADIVSLQETKCPELPSEIEALDEYCFKKLAKSTKNLGHAGVAMLAKEMPINVTVGLGNKDFDEFGRYIEAEYKNFFFISVYVPNSGSGLVNLPARGRWDQMFLTRVIDLDKRKPVIIAGDMNVAHQEIDLRNPDSNRNKTAGFTDQEREAFTRLLDAGFVDVWRSRNPGVAETYTYWYF
uniref:DNA-(apurinic or apyrimidinic site) endonuclease n=1 Tax=Meloidogyne incognita TaxID=6306 RepID=A0A914LBY0_MELIC